MFILLSSKENVNLRLTGEGRSFQGQELEKIHNVDTVYPSMDMHKL